MILMKLKKIYYYLQLINNSYISSRVNSLGTFFETPHGWDTILDTSSVNSYPSLVNVVARFASFINCSNV